MKCPKCGAWNAAYLPKCTQCGAPLPQKEDGPAAWEESLYKKKPSLKVTTFDEKEELSASEQKPQSDDAGFDPEELNRADLTDELEDLKKRREDGKKRIRQMKEQADGYAFDSALNGAIRDAKGRDVKAIRGMLDLDRLKPGRRHSGRPEGTGRRKSLGL